MTHGFSATRTELSQAVMEKMTHRFAAPEDQINSLLIDSAEETHIWITWVRSTAPRQGLQISSNNKWNTVSVVYFVVALPRNDYRLFLPGVCFLSLSLCVCSLIDKPPLITTKWCKIHNGSVRSFTIKILFFPYDWLAVWFTCVLLCFQFSPAHPRVTFVLFLSQI